MVPVTVMMIIPQTSAQYSNFSMKLNSPKFGLSSVFPRL